MPTLAPLLVAVLVGVTVLLSHRDLRTLRNGHTLLGVYAGLAGAALSLAYAYQVSAVILAAGSTDACAGALGLTGDRSSLRALVSVTRESFPPRVVCSSGGRSVVLTSPSSTQTWVHVWAAGALLLALAVLLVSWGLFATRGWRTRVASPV